MSIDWIRKTYDVPAKRGGRVEYTGDGKPELGTICGASGSHLSIRLDSAKHAMPFHPTWKLRYLDADADADADDALSIEDRIHLECTGHLPEDF